MDVFVKNIRFLMKDYGMSLIEFADHIGFTQPTISKWLKQDKYPSYQAIIAICENFSISADWLLFGEKRE